MNPEPGRSPSAHPLLQHFTAWTLGATVLLYTIGRASQSYTYQALNQSLGVNGFHLDTPWQDHVFRGGVDLVNALIRLPDEPRSLRSPWVIALLLFGLCLWGSRRIRETGNATPRLRAVARGLAVISVPLALFAALNLALQQGRRMAQTIRDNHQPPL